MISLEPEEAATLTNSDDTACLKEMDRAPPIHVNVKKMCKRLNQLMVMGSTAMVEPPKRNPRHKKPTSKELYKWALPCFHIKEAEMPCKRTGKPKVVAIWATCKFCTFKLPGCRVYSMKTSPVIVYCGLDVSNISRTSTIC